MHPAHTLRCRGFHWRQEGDRLMVSPTALLTDQDRSLIKESRQQLLDIIQPVSHQVGHLASPEQVLGLLARSPVACLDLETTGLSPQTDRIRLLSVSDGEDTLVLDCFRHNLRQVFFPYLKGQTLVAHHALFDLGFLFHAGLYDLPPTVCTYLCAKLVEAGTGNGCSLKECCKRYLGIEMDKDLQASGWSGEVTREQIEYARRDAAILPRLVVRLGQEIVRKGLMEDCESGMQALPMLVMLQAGGVALSALKLGESKWLSVHKGGDS